MKSGAEKEEPDLDKTKSCKQWSVDPQVSRSITRTPLGMIDPATYLATRGAYFIKDEASRQNGLENGSPDLKASSSHVTDPQKRLPPYIPINPSSVRQPPLSSVASLRGGSPSVKESTSTPHAPSLHAWSQTSSSPVSVGKTSSVFNIHSLKYCPSSNSDSIPSKRESPKPSTDKNVIIKTSLAPGNKDVKYIRDKSPQSHRPRSPSPDNLGPLMPDGSRARILSPASLSSLYRFPGPSKPPPKMSQPTSHNDSVIINAGHYKVTEVHGGRASTPSNQPPSGGHLVYAKPLPTCTVTRQCSDVKPPRKRHGESEKESMHKKFRPSSPPSSAASQPSKVSFNTPDFVDVASSMDPHLRGLIGAGMFEISGSNIVWGDSSKIGNECPGAPTKVALKDALLGLKKENGIKSVPSYIQPLSSSSKRVTTSLTTSVGLEENRPNSQNLLQESLSDLSERKAIEELEAPSPGIALVKKEQSAASPPVEISPKPAFCPKLKKDWIKRSCKHESTTKSSPHKSPSEISLTSEDLPIKDKCGDLEKVSKKMKKIKSEKKEAKKKKKKTKEEPKGATSDSSPASDESASSDPKEESKAVRPPSNSKLYLQGKLTEYIKGGSCSETEEGITKKKKGRRSEMPIGESELICG